MKKYKKFLTEKPVVKENVIEPNKQPEKELYIQPVVGAEPKPVQEVKKVKEEDNVSDDVLGSVVLMLNQTLKELNDINKKVDELMNKPVSMPTQAEQPEKVVESVKRKIVLTRDESGKITGADVIDSNQ